MVKAWKAWDKSRGSGGWRGGWWMGLMCDEVVVTKGWVVISLGPP